MTNVILTADYVKANEQVGKIQDPEKGAQVTYSVNQVATHEGNGYRPLIVGAGSDTASAKADHAEKVAEAIRADRFSFGVKNQLICA